MEQVATLTMRIRTLKGLAAKMRDGMSHLQLIPEIDHILALPDDISSASVGEREAVSRQVREYEQVFDSLGYSLLEQIMPTTGVSPIFEVVRAADEFKATLKKRIGAEFTIGDKCIELTQEHVRSLSRTSLSIGTPPVTAAIRRLIPRLVFNSETHELFDHVETLDCDARLFDQFLSKITELCESSLHYCTGAEEKAFLAEAREFVNFEGAGLFNRVVFTGSPERAVHLIKNHVFDKFGSSDDVAVQVVPGVDAVDADLASRMRQHPNHVFVAQVTAIPRRLFVKGQSGASSWRSVVGRLVLVDCSQRARISNTTIVYTLFPHVAQTLRNVQTSFTGRPASTQLHLRSIIERFSPETLAGFRQAIEKRMAALAKTGVRKKSVDEIMVAEWHRDGIADYFTLARLLRFVRFIGDIVAVDDEGRHKLGARLAEETGKAWMSYFYKDLKKRGYDAAIVQGGGRGALASAGEYHRLVVRESVEEFCREQGGKCSERLEQLKTELDIAVSSSDEIDAAIRHADLQALSPTQWQVRADHTSRAGYLARSLKYHTADLAGKLSRRAENTLDRAAFGNATGSAKALLKRTMKKAGLGALHGHLEHTVGRQVGDYDRRMRKLLLPFQELVRNVQQGVDERKGVMSPQALAEIESLLRIVQRGSFCPTLVMAQMSWSYQDVFPDKYFPDATIVRVPLNERHEMDPLALLRHVEEKRYMFRLFPEMFRLYCKSMLLVINSPHNPTSTVYRRQTTLRLLQIASEYGITVLDDNSYHKLIAKRQRDREGSMCVAQAYEFYRDQFAKPVSIITAAATTKGLQGAGDRTGLLHANFPEMIEFAGKQSPERHLMSVYITGLKLEAGLQVKRHRAALEQLARNIIGPTGEPAPWDRVRDMAKALLAESDDETFSLPLFQELLAGCEDLLRLRQRGGSVRHYSRSISQLVWRIKRLRIEVCLRDDVEKRFAEVDRAVAGAMPDCDRIEPLGAFYACLRLCPPDHDQGLQDFLKAIARYRKVDVTYAGAGYVRLSLGGALAGTAGSYKAFGEAVAVYLQLLYRYWQEYDAAGRTSQSLRQMFAVGEENEFQSLMDDLEPLLPSEKSGGENVALAIDPSERGIVYCIEEGRSRTDKVFVEWHSCETVDELMRSRAFRVLYRRMLKRVYKQNSDLADLSFDEIDNQYGPLACLAAYHDRQLIDDMFRQLLENMYKELHSDNVVKILMARLNAPRHKEKVASLHGMQRHLNDLITDLAHAFEIPEASLTSAISFDVGLEILDGIKAHPDLPPYMRKISEKVAFTGGTALLNPAPRAVTGAAKRVADSSYNFLRREGGRDGQRPTLEHFRHRLRLFAASPGLGDYIAKAIPIGPFNMLVLMHRSCFHLINDELRLFPQIDLMQNREALHAAPWDGVMLYGIPAKFMGDSYKSGYILEHRRDGALMPVTWVAREDATDYVGFFKKSLLTVHNELVKSMGGLPVHGAMVTLTFKNGLRKTLAFSADSGTGKSETITAMMDQLVSGDGPAAELRRVDTLAGDMLSLWRGEDGQVYAFGTETGDFMRLTDITESWKSRFGDLLKRGAYSNLDHPKNPRVTIPGICDRRKVLSPTRVNGFFYINNYEGARGPSVELSDDPDDVLGHVLVRGLRKNKGTSGDLPSLRAGLEFAGDSDLVGRFRHQIDELLDWRQACVEGETLTCLCYRDGSGDVFTAGEVVTLAFKGQELKIGDRQTKILTVSHDISENIFWLACDNGRRYPLDYKNYVQVYSPLVSTFCGNPFVEPAGMDKTLAVFARTLRGAKVHTGVIKTQLARTGYEFTGPAKASRDIITFLLEDEEVNARFQRNKDKVNTAMRKYYGGILEQGCNLPVELEGYNLLLLEEHESTHVAFENLDDQRFTLSTPFYEFDDKKTAATGTYTPAIALPEMLAVIDDICQNPDHEADLGEFAAVLTDFDIITNWNSPEELVYQILLVDGVISVGSSETEMTRHPADIRKAHHTAMQIMMARQSREEGAVAVDTKTIEGASAGVKSERGARKRPVAPPNI